MNPKTSLALVGMRGSGKTTMGRALAARLGLPHLDTDEVVADQAEKTIADIFATEGESGFRKRESLAIRGAVSAGPCVISVGGGAVLDPANVAALRFAATVVWLKASAETLHRRIQADPMPHARPPLTALPAFEEIQTVLAARAQNYAAAADLIIETDGLSPQEAVDLIVQSLKNQTR